MRYLEANTPGALEATAPGEAVTHGFPGAWGNPVARLQGMPSNWEGYRLQQTGEGLDYCAVMTRDSGILVKIATVDLESAGAENLRIELAEITRSSFLTTLRSSESPSVIVRVDESVEWTLEGTIKPDSVLLNLTQEWIGWIQNGNELSFEGADGDRVAISLDGSRVALESLQDCQARLSGSESPPVLAADAASDIESDTRESSDDDSGAAIAPDQPLPKNRFDEVELKERPCSVVAIAATLDYPEARNPSIRQACADDLDEAECGAANISLEMKGLPQLDCLADRIRLANEAEAERVRNTPYEMSEEEVFQAQTMLIECHLAQIGLPDGKLGPETREELSKRQGIEPVFNKEAFDLLMEGCPDNEQLWASLSVAADGAYHAVSNYSSGVAALRASLEGCQTKSAQPETCIHLNASTPLTDPLGLGDKNPKPGLAAATCIGDGTQQVFMAKGAFKETALAVLWENVSEDGYVQSDCEVLVVVDAYGID